VQRDVTHGLHAIGSLGAHAHQQRIAISDAPGLVLDRYHELFFQPFQSDLQLGIREPIEPADAVHQLIVGNVRVAPELARQPTPMMPSRHDSFP